MKSILMLVIALTLALATLAGATRGDGPGDVATGRRAQLGRFSFITASPLKRTTRSAGATRAGTMMRSRCSTRWARARVGLFAARG